MEWINSKKNKTGRLGWDVFAEDEDDAQSNEIALIRRVRFGRMAFSFFTVDVQFHHIPRSSGVQISSLYFSTNKVKDLTAAKRYFAWTLACSEKSALLWSIPTTEEEFDRLAR